MLSGEGVSTEALLILEIEDKGSYLIGADLGCVGGEALGVEEPLKIADTAGNRLNGLFAFPLGLGAEPVALEETCEVCRLCG